ncbi:MAG: hypothetical protein ACI9VR_002064 [Cognaticolwellia sp.]|jgi:hypothetical protein
MFTPLVLFLAADADFGSKRKQESWYRDQAQVARQAKVQRPSGTPGSSSADYQAAWDACIPVEGFGRGKERDVGTRQMTSAMRSIRPNQKMRPRRTPLAESCVSLGASPEDPLFASMQEQGCALLAHCQVAVPYLISGSQRGVGSSPLGPYSEWRVQGDVGRPAGEFLVLARVALIDAWINGGREKPAVLAERALVVLRFGRDLARGSNGMDLRVAIGIQDLALQMLHRVVQNPDLTPELALRVAEGLEAEHATPVDLSETVRVDFLITTAAIWAASKPKAKILNEVPLMVAPGGPAWDPEAWEMPKVAGPVVKAYLEGQHFPTWAVLVEGMGSSYPDNKTLLERVSEEMAPDPDGGVRAELQGMVANGLNSRIERMHRWNLDQNLIESRVCLLSTAARIRIQQPGGSCAQDPMLSMDWGQDADAAGMLLWSPALEQIELSRSQQSFLEIDVRFDIQGPPTPGAPG